VQWFHAIVRVIILLIYHREPHAGQNWTLLGGQFSTLFDTAARQAAMPEEILTSALVARFGADAVPQFHGSVPGRRYILDVAFPKVKLAVEIDGWQYHGKHLADFKRDRERDRLLVLNGWLVLRFAAGEVRKDPEYCVATVVQCIRSIVGRS